MVEALIAMPAVGPAAMRIGVASGGHEMNNQNIILGTVAADRLQSNQAISSLAKDLRTYQQEFDPFDFSVISQVKLKVGRDHMVRNMLTGNEEVVDTLVSEEGVPAETFIWEGDGGGRVYAELLDKYHEVASSPNNVTALWVSYLPENAKNSGRNNRIYKLEKTGNDVTLTSYTAGGSEKSMRDFMDNISGVKHDRNSSLHGQTVFFSPREDDVSHRKVYGVLFDSLTPDEKVKSAKYLDRFSRELGISDAERNARNIARDKMYAEMIREKMLKDNNVKMAFALVAQAVAYEVESNYRRAQSVQINEVSQALPNLPMAIEKKEEIKAKKEKEDAKSESSRKDTTSENPHEAFGVVAQVLAVISKETEEETPKQVIAEQVFEPIVPILQAILTELAQTDITQPSEPQNQESETQNYEFRDITSDSPSRSPCLSGRQVFEHLEGVTKLLLPGEFVRGSYQNIDATEIPEIHEVLKVLLTEFNTSTSGSEEFEVTTIQSEEIKTVANDILEFFIHNGQVSEDSIVIEESLLSIKLLFEVYGEEKTPQDLKELISLFLFHELVKICENKELIDKYPELAIILSTFEPVFNNPIFKRRYEEFILCIEKLWSRELLNDDGFRDFSIIELLKFMKTRQYTNIITIERLRGVRNTHVQNKNPKMKKSNFPPKGIIYQYLLSYDWYIIRLRGVIHEKTN